LKNPLDEQGILGIAIAVADKRHRGDDTCQDGREADIRTRFSEPDRGRRVWIDKGIGKVKSAEPTAV
jgi:hypothetical protein